MNLAMIMCHFVYLIPAITFFMWIFEIFPIAELVMIRVAYNAKLTQFGTCLYVHEVINCVFYVRIETLRGARIL